mmetsp:Transcript_14509/g.25028  ORF Transcript_14509/g.25028 Transcript_14509/m.25028 type:complete len:323 (-) Transcript_14509:16-984(-)
MTLSGSEIPMCTLKFVGSISDSYEPPFTNLLKAVDKKTSDLDLFRNNLLHQLANRDAFRFCLGHNLGIQLRLQIHTGLALLVLHIRPKLVCTAILKQPLLANARAKITKRLLSRLSVQLVVDKQRLQSLLNIIILHLIKERKRKPRRVGSTSYPKLVCHWARSYESDFGHVRTSASVRASRHSHDDLLLPQAELAKQFFNAINDIRHVALSLSHSKSAQWEGRAGHGSHLVARILVCHHHAMLRQNRLHLALVLRLDVLQNDVLVGGNHHVQLHLVYNGAERGFQHKIAVVLDSAVLDEQAEEQLAVPLIVPSEPVLILPGG